VQGERGILDTLLPLRVWNNQNSRQNWLSYGLAGDARGLKERFLGQVLARFGQFGDRGRTPALVQAPMYARPLKLIPVSSLTMRFRFIAMTVR